jgi:hypothetical protein
MQVRCRSLARARVATSSTPAYVEAARGHRSPWAQGKVSVDFKFLLVILPTGELFSRAISYP